MRFTSYTTASVMAALATAQTFSDCNPTQKDCPNDPAMPQNWSTDFTAGKDSIKGWKQTAGSLKYSSDGAQFVISQKGDAPTIGSDAYFHFGYVEVTMKASSGQGIVSSIVLESDDLDEVDWEWIGGVDSKVQTNYFGKGNTTTYDRMIQYDVANNQNEFHTYALNWTAESLTWLIDSKPVRTLNYADAVGGKNYPQTPCNLRLGNWAGGDSDSQGTREWAGGSVDYSKSPFTMTVKSVKVINYSPGTEYQYTDKSGDYKSIKVVGAGNSNGSPQNSAVIGASATASGAPLASGVNAPTGSVTTKNAGSGTSYATGTSPCDCGVATVTMTRGPGGETCVPSTTTVTVTSGAPRYPTGGMVTQVSSAASVITVSPVNSGYATTGIAVDTRSVPSVPVPSYPATSVPKQSAVTTRPPVPQFTGAAAHNKAGVLVGALAGALVLAL